VRIALVGKYTQLHDAYLSVVEALAHAGTANDAVVEIKWVDSENLTAKNAAEQLGDVTGILVPGGFGDRGIEGMITAVQYAREHSVPYFGICLGMQMAVVEFAATCWGYADANSSEFSETTAHPVIALMPDQVNVVDKGGTMRLGKYPCVLLDGTRSRELYGVPEISERHRHRFEFNNDFREGDAVRRHDAGGALAQRQAGGDRGAAGPPVVRGRPVPPRVQEPPQPRAAAVLRLCEGVAGAGGETIKDVPSPCPAGQEEPKILRVCAERMLFHESF
jgi:hypothetical protein